MTELAVNVCFILNLILCIKNEKHHRHRKGIATQSYLGEAAAVRALLPDPTWVWLQSPYEHFCPILPGYGYSHRTSTSAQSYLGMATVTVRALLPNPTWVWLQSPYEHFCPILPGYGYSHRTNTSAQSYLGMATAVRALLPSSTSECAV